MPRAEKSTKELKKDLERITEKYERALEKDNRKIAEVVRKFLGDEPDLAKLDEVLAKATEENGTFASSGKQSTAVKVRTVPEKAGAFSEQNVPADGTAEDDE